MRIRVALDVIHPQFQARVHDLPFLFKCMAAYVGYSGAPLKIRYEESGFYAVTIFEIVRRDTHGVQVGFLTESIGFTYRDACRSLIGEDERRRLSIKC